MSTIARIRGRRSRFGRELRSRSSPHRDLPACGSSHAGTILRRSWPWLPVVSSRLPAKTFQDVAQLERLAPEIERAQTLSPETKDAIGRLVARQTRSRVQAIHRRKLRRKAAIERITGAMKAKEASTVASGGFRPPQD